MLAVRVIPTVLCKGRTLVKGERFNPWRSVGLAEQAVRIHQARGVDELVLLDVTATAEGRGPDLGLIEELTEGCFMPLAVGGGVRSLADVRALLKAGADKIVIGTAAAQRVDLVWDVAETVGSQACVVAVDVKDGAVWSECGSRMHTIKPVNFSVFSQKCGAGEIILTSIDREGTQQGYDLDLIREVSSAVSIPVVAHGGCSGYEDMARAVEAGASAVAAGALFQFTDATPRDAAKYLAARGIEARV